MSRFPQFQRGQRTNQLSAAAMNELVKMVQRVANLDVVLPLRKSVHAGGIRIKLDESFIPRPKAPVGGIKPFIITGMNYDYFLAEPADGGDEVKIAKRYKLRRGPFDGKTIRGRRYVYHANFNKRDVTFEGETERQIIIPRYLGRHIVGDDADIIWASRTDTRLEIDGVAVEWLEDSDGRAWAKEDA